MDQSTKEYIDTVLAKVLSNECRVEALTNEVGALFEQQGSLGKAAFMLRVQGAYEVAMTDVITQLNPLNKDAADILESILKQSIDDSLKAR